MRKQTLNKRLDLPIKKIDWYGTQGFLTPFGMTLNNLIEA